MAKNVDKKVIKAVEKYIAEIRKHYNIKDAFLFGSFAQGTQHDCSDIDVAIILDKIQNKFDEMVKLYKYTRGIDARIEPHPIMSIEFNRKNDPLVNEVLRTGIKII